MNSTSRLLDDALGLTVNTNNKVILIEDCVETSGAFILHHLMKRSLSSELNGTVIFVSLSQSFSHYDRIMRKMGSNLVLQRKNKMLQFLDMMKLEYPDGHKDGLVGLFAKIQSAVEESSSSQRITIMIDDLSLLEVAARGSSDDVLDFLHHCVTLTCDSSCSLVILTHEDIYPSGEGPRLLSNLEYLADTVIKTDPLSTGLAADVHGQLTIIKKVVFDKQRHSTSKISNFHFRVKENGVECFYPGSRNG